MNNLRRLFISRTMSTFGSNAYDSASKRRKINEFDNKAPETHQRSDALDEKGRSDNDVLFEVRKTNNLKRLNSLINEAAKRKKYSLAKKVFDSITEKSLKPDLFSYTCLLNACVRSGDIEKAIECFESISREGLKPNEVTYTTLLRAYCSEEKYFESASSLLDKMRADGVKPNDRTYSTFLRSCYRFGKIEEAVTAFRALKSAGVRPTVPILNLMIKIWAIGGHIDQALSTMENMEKANEAVDTTSYLICASMTALMGRRAKVVESLIAKFDTAVKLLASAATDSTSAAPKENKPISAGADVDDEERQAFAAKTESQFERKLVGQFLGEKKNGTLTHKPDANEITAGPKGNMGKNGVFFELSPVDHQQLLLDHIQTRSRSGPCKLEICAGSGDWILKKCKQEPQTSWYALEIRYDRIHDIWRKLKMKGFSNLFILCGDASTYTTSLPSLSFDEVFINFPEPIHSRDSNRLINSTLLSTVIRLLKPSGKLFVATDDRLYAECISEDLSALDATEKGKRGRPEAYLSHDLPANYGPSYFDKLWKSRGREDRFFISYEKSAKPTKSK